VRRAFVVGAVVALALSIEAPGASAGSLSCGWSIDGSLAESSVSLLSVDSISSTSVWAVGWRALGDIDRTVTVHSNGTGWTVEPSPNPNGHYDVLAGVAGTSDTDVWAVGTTGSSFPYGSLIEHWNGSAWTVVPAPDGVVGALNAVSADSPTDAWIVGEMDGTVAHWDGDRCLGGGRGHRRPKPPHGRHALGRDRLDRAPPLALGTR